MKIVSRIKSLDSLRGIAALTVVIAHACGTLIKGHSLDEFTPLYLFRAAHESVIFFFLLSGFVLTYQVQKQNYFNYKNFIVNRFFRIYIPYLLIILFVFISFRFFYSIYGNIAGKEFTWGKPLNFQLILNHLILIGNFNTNAYNPVIWSLVHEMRVSLIFPLLLYIITFKWTKVLSICIFISLLANFGIIFNINTSEGYNNSYFHTLHYFSLFVIGGLVLKNLDDLKDWYTDIKPKYKSVLLISSLLVYNYSRMLFLIPHKFKFFRISLFNEFIADWFTALSAVFFIILANQIINKTNWLLHPFPLFLGKISYSLYLVHMPVAIIFFNIFLTTNRIIVMIFSIITSIILSAILNKYIEQRCAFLGKKFSSNKNRVLMRLEKQD